MYTLRSLTLTALLPVAAVAQQQDPQTAWHNFTAKHGTDWRVEWNPATKTPSAIYGPGLNLAGPVESLDAARVEANRLFDTYSALLGRGDSRFVEIIGEKTNKVFTLVYDQEYKGLPVISGRADMRINEIGVVALFGSSAVQIPQGFNTDPGLSADAARTVAEELVLGAASKVADHAAPRLVVWADTEAKLPTTATLAWEVQIDERPAAVKVGKAYIDARAGALLQFKDEVYTCNMCTSVHVAGGARKSRVEKALELRNELAAVAAPKAQPGMPKFAYIGKVQAWVNLGHNPLDALTLTPLKNCLVTSSAGSAYTDNNGNFTIASTSTSSVVVTATLTGRYTKRIRVAQGTQMSVSATFAANSSNTLTFGTSASPIFDRAQTTCYYFTDDCHNWLRSLLPASTALTNLAGMDPRVNIASTCNAYYTGYTINFYNAG
ncbi:MAG: hypothetical protein KDC87_16905, partial [Planctomycetes bacterium]|nr:hypothetical protein [Planctomycetota bacterium]